MEAAMKKLADNRGSELHDIYFGKNALIHYEAVEEDMDLVPFIVVGQKDSMSVAAAIEFMSGCRSFKILHKELFGIEVKSFVMAEGEFKKVKDWWKYFHPHGLYR
jgi:hypothetical protein